MDIQNSKSAGNLLIELIAYTFVAIIAYFILNVPILLCANWYLYGYINSDSLNSVLFANLHLMKFVQGLSSIVLFGLPTWLMYRKNSRYLGTIGFRGPNQIGLLLILLIYICSVTLLQYLGIINQDIKFPPAWTHIEQYLKTMEEQAKIMTENLLKGTSWYDLLLNLCIIAVLPAIFEEIFFRGVFQKIFQFMFKNTHLSIWVTAFIFSAIHLQFYGFLPRLLLGAILGYVYAYSHNIWYNITLHLINNGIVVALYYYLTLKNLPLELADKDFDLPIFLYLLFAIALVALLYLFRKKQSITNPDY